jgi:hypothetical protein
MGHSQDVILNEVKNPSSTNFEFWIMNFECEEVKPEFVIDILQS